jgi:HK97 family phage prohead protease
MTEHLDEGYRFDAKVVDMDDAGDEHRAVLEFPTNDTDTDTYKTGWRSGVFAESFKKRLPVMLANHNQDMLIGSAVTAESLGDRARIVNRFANFAKVPKAEEVHSLMADGHYPGASFHFRNAKSVQHPNVRGARLFVQADMLETSPVVFPSIGGAKITDVRSEEDTLTIPTIEEILLLQERGVLTVEGVRSAIAEHFPFYKEHITVQSPGGGPDPAAAADPPGGGAGSGTRDDEDAGVLARAVDAALDEACNLIDTVGDRTSLPEPIQQAIDLTFAAGVAVDELLEVMGVGDPDDGSATGGRATLDAAAANKLDDSDFAYIDSKGGRHLPIPDAAHVRNALARFDQTSFDSPDDKAKAKAKLAAAAKKFGIDMAGDRSDGPSSGETINLEGALARLDKYKI